MKRLAAFALLAMAATATDAAALPLKPGLYALKGQPCADPPLAAMFQFNGQAFSYPHAGQCRSTILSRKAHVSRLRETCSALGDGTPAAPVTTVSPYEVQSKTEVLIHDEAGGGASSYRWYPAAQATAFEAENNAARARMMTGMAVTPSGKSIAISPR